MHVDVPFFHEVFLVTVKCSNCNLRVSDVVSMRFGKPMRYILQVREPSDLSSKVIRSVTSTIRIPELGAILEPGPAAQPFITNVEGVLHRFL
ncbi:MAG: ZPR1 zinc finger domain-containing protein, partial [Candidatus Jordarchaeales archaeon]